MNPGDIVTISPPFGDDTTEFVVSGVVDPETSLIQHGADHLAYSNVWLTVVGTGGEFDPPPGEEPSAWWIYPGPFMDRLGMDALAIAASTHPICVAANRMMIGRLYIDLKGPQASNLLDMLIATGQPAASPYFPGSGPMTTEKKAVILGTLPTEQERYKG